MLNGKRWSLFPLLLGALGAACASTTGPPVDHAAPPVPVSAKVLLLTGEDYPGHDWKSTTPVLAAALARDPRLEIVVHDDLATLAQVDLAPFGAVVAHFKNYDPAVPGRAGFDNLRSFVQRGGGLVLVHFACGAFEEFRDEFEPLVGRVWFGASPPPGEFQHDPYGAFQVSITDGSHPVTRGLAPFTTTDELYTCLAGETPIDVLACATSVRNGKEYPMAFVVDEEGRRVFHCVLGHDPAALAVPAVGELYRRATAWAVRLDPALPASSAALPSEDR